jgi:hypothetical protein
MTIVHDGFTFVGVAEEAKFGTWERQVQYVTTFGNPGASALDGKRTVREFQVRVYCYNNFANAAAVYTYLGTCDSKIGAVGTYVDNGLQPKTIENVEFLGLELEQGPLPTAPDEGWIAVINLSFKQLSPS